MWKEFKEFSFKGNVVDMAVGVMIGAAFGKIVASVVGDIVMPLLSVLTGRVDLSGMALTLGEGANAPVLNYGAFIQTILDFFVITLCIFGFVKGIAALRKQLDRKEEQTPAPAPRLCPYCVQPVDAAATRCPHCTSQLN